MKKIVAQFKVGDLVVCEVVEILNVAEIIVSFKGDLLRVENLTYRSLRVGEIISLKVQSVQPLSFRMISLYPMGFERTI